jgi:hypothetical protein
MVTSPPEEEQYTLNIRLGVPQNRSGLFEKKELLLLPASEPRSV